uniref:Uncharacterized protein n=1 Tax=Panagrolaimus superbus TaxID=310955 RepID=A0A914Z0S2_9BILA
MANYTLEITPFISHTSSHTSAGAAGAAADEEQCIHVSEAIAAQGIDDVTKAFRLRPKMKVSLINEELIPNNTIF